MKLKALLKELDHLLPLMVLKDHPSISKGQPPAIFGSEGTFRVAEVRAYLSKHEQTCAYLVHAANQLPKLVEALEHYAECIDGCTCGDGWDHGTARDALAKATEVKL